MVILKKINSATLIETLTASVLIVIVFMMASLTINSVFKGTVKKDVSAIETKVKQLYYLQLHQKIKLPYEETYLNWEISIPKQDSVQIFYSNKETSKSFIYPN